MDNYLFPTPLFDSLQYFLNKELKYNIDLSKYSSTDHSYIKDFLLSYRGSVATFNAYRRETERFFHWCALVANKEFKNIKRQDFEQYLDFCQNPPHTWISTKNVSRFITDTNDIRCPNPEWRPFVVTVSKIEAANGKRPNIHDYELSEKAFREIFAILSSFYNFLMQENYVEINPVLQIRQKSKYLKKQNASSKIVRKLSELQWGYVIETAKIMAANEPEKHNRTLFIISALYGMYLRISELAANNKWTPKMGDFFRDHDNLWWFKTVGKGNKERLISVSNDMLAAFKHYRISLSLPALPPPGDNTPLIPKLTGKGAMKCIRTIRSLVQECFDKTVQRLNHDGLQEESGQVMAATVHWLRHTGISDDVKIRPREHVRDDAGHGSGAITDRYIDVEKRERNASAKNKKIVPDCINEDITIGGCKL